MSKMSKQARIYWAVICLLGLTSTILSQAIRLAEAPHSKWEFLIFIALAVTIGGRKVNLTPSRRDEEAGSLTLGFAITFAGLLRLGPNLAVLIAVASCLSSCMFPRRQRWFQLFFNLSLSAIDGVIGCVVFAYLNGFTLKISPGKTFTALAGSSLCFFLINTFGVAVMISLNTNEKATKIWKENFSWTAPSYFASGSVGALAAILFNGSSVAPILFALPVAYLVYQSYVTYISRAEDRQRHIEELQKKQHQLSDLYIATIKSLALAIDAKDQYTHQHILRVQRYAVAIAEEMGLEGDEFEAVRTGALLHDVGKLGVPEYVLLKQGPLTPEEYEKVKKHPEIGAAILDPVEFPWPVIPVVRHHHERWDGTGYPDGLKGEEIPVTARIMAVADVYDAVTSTRAYRRAWSHDRAVDLIKRDTGTYFSPDVTAAFLRVIDRVVREMADEGFGPLVLASVQPVVEDSKAVAAAKHISRASTELWALYEVAQSLSGSLGIKHTAELVVRKVEEIYAGATCVFFQWEPDSMSLTADSAFGFSRELFLNASASSNSISRRVIANHETYMGPFDPSDLTLIHGSAGQWIQPKTALIVPVVAEGKPIGTINLYHPAAAAFTEYDRELLELIAERAASALFNGILFDRTRGDSLTDPLTGVSNLRFLTGHVDELATQKSLTGTGPQPFAILCLDLDSFKPINDDFGHAKGNDVLQDVAKLFSDVVSTGGIVARSGGDEFVVVLSNADQSRAEHVALSLQAAIETYDPGLIHHRLGQLRVGVSVGVACFPHDGRDCTSLLSIADHRMYLMKTERRLKSLAMSSEAPRFAERTHMS